MHEWLSGGVSPCQGEGRGFESRLVLEKTSKTFYKEFGVFLLYRKLRCNSYKAKTLREDAHSREGKLLLSQPRSAQGFRKRNLFLLYMYFYCKKCIFMIEYILTMLRGGWVH